MRCLHWHLIRVSTSRHRTKWEILSAAFAHDGRDREALIQPNDIPGALERSPCQNSSSS